ncbi:hypothetical protein HFO56_24290 [Rhizobium laguerreae]|uniref:hypothetical protein n=1 Tax=Rhizobium laguerreae TaxID=1076926 RepID=UPI001C9268F6|nr:hypothetical protein [Rhizobium laguerreae]MBY3155450.1 hypothetical protein [Rhizobium laguerreae]
MTKDEQIDTKDYIRAALTTTRLVAGREVVIRPDGITVTDPFNGKHHFANLGPPPPKSLIDETLRNSFYSYTGSRDREMKASGHGAWQVTEKDGNFVLKATKKRHAALEALVAADAEHLALMRSLYGVANVDILVACEGDARTREVALAFASELNLSGRHTTLDLAPERGYAAYSPRVAADDQDGPELFEVPQKVGQQWIVAVVEEPRGRPRPPPPPAGVSRIVVFEDEHAARNYGKATEGSFAPSRRPAVLVGIALEDSTPTATIVMSAAAKAAARADLDVKNAPWTIYNERKAARLKSRPPVAKTWHQTTDQVARAFVARKAPRGFVSNKSLFFHGPVAFSVYERNPVAALVDLPNGKTLLFSGRDSGQHNTLAGTVSSAMGDIHVAATTTEFREFHVGELTDFLTLGDLQLDAVASRVGRGKKEAEYPSSCSVDAAKLEEYIVKRRNRADAELEQTSKQSVATYTKSASWRELANIARFRNAMVELLGIPLPDMGDADEFAARAKSISNAAQTRQEKLRKFRVVREKAEREAKERAEAEEDRDIPARNPFRHIR